VKRQHASTPRQDRRGCRDPPAPPDPRCPFSFLESHESRRGARTPSGRRLEGCQAIRHPALIVDCVVRHDAPCTPFGTLPAPCRAGSPPKRVSIAGRTPPRCSSGRCRAGAAVPPSAGLARPIQAHVLLLFGCGMSLFGGRYAWHQAEQAFIARAAQLPPELVQAFTHRRAVQPASRVFALGPRRASQLPEHFDGKFLRAPGPGRSARSPGRCARNGGGRPLRNRMASRGFAGHRWP